jgi:predicted permease
MRIKQLVRILFRNKTFSILNVAGLAIGIACAALILLWVENEMTYNDFPKQKQLYVLYQNQTYNTDIYSFPVAPNPLAAALKEEVPGIKEVMRYNDGKKSVFSIDEKILYETGVYADASIFDMLDIQFIQGNATSAFSAAYPVVITEQMAVRFFGKEDPVGQTLKKDNGQEYVVTAVVKAPKQNSDFTYSWIIPFQQLVKDYVADGWQDAETTWNNNWMTDYVELETSADAGQINERIKDLLKEKRQDPTTTLFLYPLTQKHLYGDFKNGKPTGNGYIRYVKLFFWIAVIILVIACINFVNLSTARSQKRIKEVGVRKTFGAKRVRLVRQFMGESGIITCMALLLSVVFVSILLPPFNLLVGKNLALGWDNTIHLLGLLCIGLVCTVVAGGYPAFFLSSFPPIDVLRKLQTRIGSGVARIRQGLVVFQFTASVTLIICTAFIYLQVQHTKNRSLGMNVEQVLIAEANNDIRSHFEPLKQELLATGVVENVGLSSQRIMDIWSNGGSWKWQGKPDNIDPLVSVAYVNDGVFPTLGIPISEGRNFEQGDPQKNNILINRAFAELIGEEGRVGGRLWQGNNADEDNILTIVGIVGDFVFNDPFRTKIGPAVFWMDENGSNLFIRLRAGNMQASLQSVENVFKRIDPNHPFEYRFMDEQFNNKFKSTLLVGKLAGLFAALAIFISCLGLFGLTAFAAEQRTREIGIRTVLGASVMDIVKLLGRNFMLLIGMSFVIAIPLSWWLMHQWLQNYEYRIGISWWVFAASGLLVIVIALLTVSFQSIKAATADPVDSIKSE